MYTYLILLTVWLAGEISALEYHPPGWQGLTGHINAVNTRRRAANKVDHPSGWQPLNAVDTRRRAANKVYHPPGWQPLVGHPNAVDTRRRAENEVNHPSGWQPVDAVDTRRRAENEVDLKIYKGQKLSHIFQKEAAEKREVKCKYGDVEKAICKSVKRHHCYLLVMQTQCCATCRRFKNGPAGCEYGDRDATQCAILVPRNPTNCNMQQTRDLCCASCGKHQGNDKACKYGDTDKKMCSLRAGMNPGHCYDVHNQRTCCATCRKNKKGPKGCEYGDRAATFRIKGIFFRNCKSLISYFGSSKCVERLVKYNCCKTCRGRRK